MDTTRPPVTQTFDPSIGEYGQDYAVPVGTPILSPVSGIFGSEDQGKSAWGKRAFVHASSGISFAVGHLTSFAKAPGDLVNIGDVIGYSGGDPNDPSSGNTTGAHVEAQWFTSAGKFLDPRNIPGVAAMEGVIFGAAKTATSAAGGGIKKGSSGLSDPFGLGHLWDSIAAFLQRGLWIWLGLGAIVLGLLLLVFEDFERIAKQAAPPLAETAAKNPEVVAA